jgi:two-component system response regulator
MSTPIVLIVDDSPDDLALAMRAFQKNQISAKLMAMTDGAEAMDYLFCTENHTACSLNHLPSLILLDLKLPKFSGLELLVRIRSDARTCFIPVIVLTSSRERQDMIASYNAGANSYVRKPVDFTEFMTVIKHMSAYWLLSNEVPLLEGANP